MLCHLYGQGTRKLAFVSGPPDSFDNAERMGTFLAEAEQHGLAAGLSEPSPRFPDAEAARAVLQSGELPDAVFCSNDQMAIGFLRATRNGLHAPDDVAVVGFDNIPLTRYTQPTLSTVGASRFEWGRERRSPVDRVSGP
ncbi:MAG: substrate-binding domain-containing protein [Anaerolineae bacterium]